MATIRPATPEDRLHLIKMRHALQAHDESSNPHIWKITEEGRRQREEEIDAMLNDPDATTLVAEVDSTPIAFIHATVSNRTHVTPRTVGFINLIYVDPHHRRQGIATDLIRSACRTFTRRGAEEVNLNYIKGNTHAETLWKKLGLEPIRITASTPIEDLEKRLDEQSTDQHS